MGWLENKISGIQEEMEAMATKLVVDVGTLYTKRPELLVDAEAGPVGAAMDALLPYTVTIIVIVTTWSLGASAISTARGQGADWGETIGYLLRNFVVVGLVIAGYGLISRASGEMSVAMIDTAVRDTDFIENMKLMILLGGEASAGMMALSLFIQGIMQGICGFLLFAKDFLGIALLAPLVFAAAISHGRTGTGLFNNVLRLIAAVVCLDIFIGLGMMISYSMIGADLSEPGGFQALWTGILFSFIQIVIPFALATLIGMPSINIDSLSRLRNGAAASATRYMSTRVSSEGKAVPANGAASNGSTPSSSTPAQVPATTPSGASSTPSGSSSAPGMSSRATTTNLGSSAPGAASSAGAPGAAGKAAAGAGAAGAVAGGAAVVGAAGAAAVKSTASSVNAAAPTPTGAKGDGSVK